MKYFNLTYRRMSLIALAFFFVWLMDAHAMENALRVLFVFVLVVGYKEL